MHDECDLYVCMFLNVKIKKQTFCIHSWIIRRVTHLIPSLVCSIVKWNIDYGLERAVPLFSKPIEVGAKK